MKRHFLFHGLEPYTQAQEIPQWPLHLMVIPPFKLEGIESKDFHNHLSNHLSYQEPFQVATGEKLTPGPTDNTEATPVIDETGKLEQLHNGLMKFLGDTGCSFLYPSLPGEVYRPIIRHERGKKVPERFTIDMLAIGTFNLYDFTVMRRRVINHSFSLGLFTFDPSLVS